MTRAENASTEPTAINPSMMFTHEVWVWAYSLASQLESSAVVEGLCSDTGALNAGTLHSHGHPQEHLTGPRHHLQGRATVMCLSLLSSHLGVKRLGELLIVMPKLQICIDSPSMDWTQWPSTFSDSQIENQAHTIWKPTD